MASLQIASPAAVWRSAATDSMYGSGDFPEPVLMLIEPLNGPKGKPTYHQINYTMNSDGTTKIVIEDDGAGMNRKESARLLTWSSATSVDALSKNGHGTKKFLAKHGPHDMFWTIETRAHYPGPITRYTGPWLGPETDVEDGIEMDGFPMTGFRITLVCATSILFYPGETPDAKLLFGRIKELICSRKSQEVLDRIDYRLSVVDTTSVPEPTIVRQSSHAFAWRSLKATLLATPGVDMIHCFEMPLVETKSNLRLTTFRSTNDTIEGFPVYGTRAGDNLQRVHIFNDDTMIEAVAPRTIVGGGRDAWPNYVTFIECCPVDRENLLHIDSMPMPATTKVSYRRECPIFQKVLECYKAQHKEIVKKMTNLSKKPKAPVPVPMPLPAPAPIPTPDASKSVPTVPLVGGGHAMQGGGGAVPAGCTAPQPSKPEVKSEPKPAAKVPEPAPKAPSPVPSESESSVLPLADITASSLRGLKADTVKMMCGHYKTGTTVVSENKKRLVGMARVLSRLGMTDEADPFLVISELSEKDLLKRFAEALKKE